MIIPIPLRIRQFMKAVSESLGEVIGVQRYMVFVFRPAIKFKLTVILMLWMVRVAVPHILISVTIPTLQSILICM